MKILQIIPSLAKGGAERLVLDICNTLNTIEGVVVKLISFSEKNEYPDLSKDIDWQVIPSNVKLSIYKKNKFQIDDLQDSIENFDPDIIHTHLFEAEILSRSCFYPKAKWFSHCHDNMRQFARGSFKTFINKQKFTEFYEKLYLFRQYAKNKGTHFIAISKNTKEYFQKNVNNYTVSLLPNAIDVSKFYWTKNYSEKANELKLINVGSISENKNQTFLIDVSQILKKRNIEFKLQFLGNGVILDELKDKTKQIGLEKEITFHGNLSRVENYLWESDLYLHSAKSEALGLTIIEAMASGLPVVTLDGKGNRDLIEQGKNGYMIYEQNAELFAQTIIDLCNNNKKYREMSAYAQEYAKQYDIKPYVDKLLVLYQNALDEGSSM